MANRVYQNVVDLANDYITKSYGSYLNQSVTIGASEMVFDIYNVSASTALTSSILTGCTANDANSQLIVGYNLSVASDETITPPYRCKGLFIVSGSQFTNDGTISMTARGASAQGVDIPLIGDKFVSAVGGAGGPGVRRSQASGSTYGASGFSPTEGVISCGGGGSGGACANTGKHISGAGGAGTSFSGGTGGGGAAPLKTGYDGSTNGGQGGRGSSGGARGGAGNPVGISTTGDYNYTADNKGEGTGGLIVIASPTIYSTGTIISSGSQGPGYSAHGSGTYNGAYACGGASGGGCICLIADTFDIQGSVSAPGGSRSAYPYADVSNSPLGGLGGAGSVVQLDLGESPIGDLTNPVNCIAAPSEYDDSVPIKNGQLLFNTDQSGLLYDWNFVRRSVGDNWETYN